MLKGFTTFYCRNGKDYFVVSDAKRRTKKDAARIASAAGLPAGKDAVDYIYCRMQAGTIEFKAAADREKTIAVIKTAGSTVVDILENGDTVVIW